MLCRTIRFFGAARPQTHAWITEVITLLPTKPNWDSAYASHVDTLHSVYTDNKPEPLQVSCILYGYYNLNNRMCNIFLKIFFTLLKLCVAKK
jgi:hypothetical protein